MIEKAWKDSVQGPKLWLKQGQGEARTTQRMRSDIRIFSNNAHPAKLHLTLFHQKR